MDAAPSSSALLRSMSFPLKVGALELRPLSAPSLSLLQTTGNALLRVDPESAAAADLGDPAVMQAMQEFIFIHAAPFEEVLRAARLPRPEWEDAVLLWGHDKIMIEDLQAGLGSYGEQAAAAGQALVEPEDAPADAPAADPN